LEWSVTVSRECKWKSSPLLKGDLPRPSIDIVFDRLRNFANVYLHDAFFALDVSDLRSLSKFNVLAHSVAGNFIYRPNPARQVTQ
jgi:hypothetical protein